MDAYTELRLLLTERFGTEIRYAPRIAKTIRRNLRRRGFENARAYLEHVRAHLEEELGNLADWGLGHTTTFGRDPAFWNLVCREVLNKVPRGPALEAYRILSLGCSKGDELATVALLAYQRFGDLASIAAYDISPKAVESARDPLFVFKHLKRIPDTAGLAHLVARQGRGRQVRLLPEVSKLLDAQVADARLVELPDGHFDLVFCRNLPFYFDPPTVEAFYLKLWKALKPKGYLGIGSVDPKPSRALFVGVGEMLYRHILPPMGTQATEIDPISQA